MAASEGDVTHDATVPGRHGLAALDPPSHFSRSFRDEAPVVEAGFASADDTITNSDARGTAASARRAAATELYDLRGGRIRQR